MIPLKLQIKNFLSYGSPTQTIDFEPHHLVCLSGKNGHGKSALLEALTWALWGNARKTIATTKADEGLLRLGQTNMVVALDFLCNGNTYRVRREFSLQQYNKKSVQLDFGILHEETAHHRTLTGKTIRETQEKICKTIGLDFEAFENSIFLRQGHSNAFSKKSPKERKEVLANILGLAKYESFRKKAAETAREKELLKKHISQTCTQLQESILKKPEQEKKLTELKASYDLLITEETELSKKNNQNLEEKRTLEKEQQEIEIVRFECAQLEKSVEKNISTLNNTFTTWRMITKKKRHTFAYSKTKKEKKSSNKSLKKFKKKSIKILSSHKKLCSSEINSKNVSIY